MSSNDNTSTTDMVDLVNEVVNNMTNDYMLENMTKGAALTGSAVSGRLIDCQLKRWEKLISNIPDDDSDLTRQAKLFLANICTIIGADHVHVAEMFVNMLVRHTSEPVDPHQLELMNTCREISKEMRFAIDYASRLRRDLGRGRGM